MTPAAVSIHTRANCLSAPLVTGTNGFHAFTVAGANLRRM
jgi:hypothetical protein